MSLDALVSGDDSDLEPPLMAQMCDGLELLGRAAKFVRSAGLDL